MQGGTPAGDASRGKQLYTSLGCAACHGTSGEGASATRVAPAGDFQSFLKVMRQPPGTMPAYPASRVSDAQVADLHAFLRSAAPAGGGAARAKAPEAAPAGDVANGKRLYETTGCWSCHGYVGQGGSAGPRLGPAAIAYPAFMAALRQPREDMPPYTAKAMPDQQVADIYAYVKTFPQPPNPDSIPLLNVGPKP
jgi:mono/diheme cytochrome c family protein